MCYKTRQQFPNIVSSLRPLQMGRLVGKPWGFKFPENFLSQLYSLGIHWEMVNSLQFWKPIFRYLLFAKSRLSTFCPKQKWFTYNTYLLSLLIKKGATYTIVYQFLYPVLSPITFSYGTFRPHYPVVLISAIFNFVFFL